MRKIGFVLLFAFLAPVAFAQNEVTIIGGASLDGDTRAAAGITFNRFFAGGWAAEVGVFQTEETFVVFTPRLRATGPLPRIEQTEDILSFSAAIHYQWNRQTRWQPYLGGGFLYAELPADIGANLATPDDSSTTMFLSGGLTYAISDDLGIRLDVRHGRWGWDGPAVMDDGVASIGARWRF
jgi:outer membrane protein W